MYTISILLRGFKSSDLKVPNHAKHVCLLGPSWPLRNPFLAKTRPASLGWVPCPWQLPEQGRASPVNTFPVLHSASRNGWLL